jgi:peptidyl-prolyl cis-trans isomerase D
MKKKALEGLDKDKLKSNSGTYSAIMIAMIAMMFFGVCDPTGTITGPRGTAASVAGEEISGQDFRRFYNYEFRNRQQQMGEAFDPSALKLANSVLTQLLDERVIYLAATRMGLRASEKEVLDEILKNFTDEKGEFSDKNFKETLRYNGFSEATYSDSVSRYLTNQKFQEFLLGSAFVSSKAVELEYKLAETKFDVEYIKVDPKAIQITVPDADVDTFAASDAGKTKIKEYYEKNPTEFKQKNASKPDTFS